MMLLRAVIFTLCYAFTMSLPEAEKNKHKGDIRRACSKTDLIPLDPQPPARVNTSSRLDDLRKQMQGTNIQAYIVTSTDEHMNYELHDIDKRLEYISGFSGTHAIAVITEDKAALWTDNRYHHQADEQIDCNWLLFRDGLKHSSKVAEWLKKELTRGAIVAVDPRLISEFLWRKLETELRGELNLLAYSRNLVDMVWFRNDTDQKKDSRAFLFNEAVAGKSHIVKISETRTELRKHGVDAMIITALDEIAWLLNIRGRDLPYSPVVRSYVILDMNEVYLYVNTKNDDRIQLENVVSDSYDRFWKDLRTLTQKYSSVLVPSHCIYSDGTNHEIVLNVQQMTTPVLKQSPIIYLKSVKNRAEILGMEETAIKDAAVFCEFMSHLEKKIKNGSDVSEQDVVTLLNEYRPENLGWLNSFPPIVAFGPNSAHPYHQALTNHSEKIFTNDSLVIESGVHYFNGSISGTTTVTRTFFFGQPSEEFKEAYTRVLIGLIQLSTLTFPSNVRMAQVDALPRSSLWEVGMDYAHESSHGIGAYLDFRESPIKVRFDSETSAQQIFKPGYFLTNEPAVYADGKFGVKLGNVMEVIEKPWLKQSGYTFLGFKTLSLLPFEPTLFKLSLLSTQQRQWLNNYNERVRQYVGAELKAEKKVSGFYWMMDKTNYIPETGRASITSSRSIYFLLVVIIFKLFIV